jgi:ubiquinone/menaquinone biosynthesis C-methylase UbiE
MWTTSLQRMLPRLRRKMKYGKLLELGPSPVFPGQVLLSQETDLDLVGLGFGPEENQTARQQARQLGIISRTRYLENKTTSLPLPDHSVDAVISFGALQKIPNLGHFLDEISRVLKHGGMVFLGDVNPEANWFSRWLAGRGTAALQRVYKNKSTLPRSAELQELVRLTELDHARVESLGPDLWIVCE